MAHLRPGRVDREPRRAWTRVAKRVAKRAYIKGVPDIKIHLFEMGNADPKACDVEVDLISSKHCQIRDNALEAARIMANKQFEKQILLENYFFRVRVYPHQILREHFIAAGAGADRISKGMSNAFGSPSGRAAMVKVGQPVFSVWTKNEFAEKAKYIMNKAGQKMQGSCKVKWQKIEHNGHS